jgi:hypothetical protein
MTFPSVIRPEQSYTFADYFRLNQPTDRILSYFGYQHARVRLSLPATARPLPTSPELQRRLEFNMQHLNLTNEAARREFLIAPVLGEVIHYTNAKINVELEIAVTQQLQGNLDYYLEAANRLLVIEANNADLQRGFTQLATQLIALDIALDVPASVLYGVVTIGEIWQFGVLNRPAKSVVQDIHLFRVPEDVEPLLRTLIAILVD